MKTKTNTVMENNTQKNVEKNKTEELSSTEKYNIILKLYKAMVDNLEDLKRKSKDDKSTTKVSQLAYKIDRIAAGLHYTLDFENEKTISLSENFRELYRHIRFAMKMVYEKQEFKFVDSSRDIAKTLYDSWSKIKPSI
mgnify:CR=1 FL=1